MAVNQFLLPLFNELLFNSLHAREKKEKEMIAL